LSQIGLAIPIILLYEISIWSARMVEKSAREAAIDRDAGNQPGADAGSGPGQ
jgi:sec-independent protein translocase protein TatC